MFFTHNSDIEREQNVVIYLTPYIVRKSGDLQKLKEILAELDEVQDRYNTIVEKILEDKQKPFFSFGDDGELPNQNVETNIDNTHYEQPYIQENVSSGHLKNLELLDSLEEGY
jgi:general secretion pathway protein D